METNPTLALVLGAGGTVGMAYHAGVLKALQDEAGLDATKADLVVGTSAGSVVAAYLRTGWTVDDLWQLSLGTHPSIAELSEEEREAQRRAHLSPTWTSPVQLLRAGLGSAAVVARSFVPVVPLAPPALGRRFPAGFYTMEAVRARFEHEVGAAWPQRPTYLCAADLRSGRRVVLGSAGAPDVDLPTAVMASCAIPGFFRPVRVPGSVLVDGGVVSTTHLDLAAVEGHRRILGIAPMAWSTASAPSNVTQLIRRRPARALSREAKLARRLGADVVLFRPSAAELEVHGPNLMDPDAGEEVARAAYDRTAALLDREPWAMIRRWTSEQRELEKKAS